MMDFLGESRTAGTLESLSWRLNMKKPLIIIGIVIAVLIVVVIALPLFIDANQFKPTLEADLSKALGRPVAIGNIQLAIFSGGVTVDNVSIADDPAFSRSPFLQAKQLTAGVALLPLIFSKKLEVASFTVTSPQVSLLRSPSGKWNFSSLGSGGPKVETQGNSTTNFTVQKLKISNGSMTVGTAGLRGKTQTYQGVEFEASNLSYSSQFPFQFSAKTPGNGAIKIDGQVGPIDSSDASLTPLEAKIAVEGLDLASTGFVAPAAGLGGLLDFNGTLRSDGHQMNSKGKVKADKIKLAVQGSPARVPVNVDYETDYDLKREAGILKQGNVRVGKALANLSGSYDTAGPEATVQMKLNGQGMAVPDLEGVLPAVGVTLPSGASLTSGTLDANLAFSGPVDKLVITGPVNLSNAKLAGFNLKSKLGALSSFTGLGGGSGSGTDTEIQTLSAALRVAPDGTHAENLNLVVPTIGTITGNGNVSSSGQLNCKMNAKLVASSGAAGSLTSAISSFGGGGNSQAGGIPFTVTGTTSNPVFVPDVTGMVGNMVKGRAAAPAGAASAASGIIGGLLNRKKSP
jgi:AsmA protein